MQRALRLVFPPQCVSCGDLVESEFSLCGPCWRETWFISGLVCDLCGAPLPGEEAEGVVHCDDCLQRPRPWARGRAALVYRDKARRLALALKHGDRTDLGRPAARWMFRAAQPILAPDLLVAPMPLHRWRLLKRRYNQAALLAEAVARRAGLEYCPDLLIRPRATPAQEGMSAEARFANMAGRIAAHPRRAARISGRRVLLVDDVMTSGASFTAAAEACHAAGAKEVFALALARAVKDA